MGKGKMNNKESNDMSIAILENNRFGGLLSKKDVKENSPLSSKKELFRKTLYEEMVFKLKPEVWEKAVIGRVEKRFFEVFKKRAVCVCIKSLHHEKVFIYIYKFIYLN